MAGMLVVVALLFVIPYACASHVHKAILVPDLMFRTLFKALRTGELELHGCFGAKWLEKYKPLPTKESVDILGRLLFGDQVDVPLCVLQECVLSPEHSLMAAVESVWKSFTGSLPWRRAVVSQQDTLMEKIMKRVSKNSYALKYLLVEYAVFKVFLYGRLGRNESKVLEAIFPECHHPGAPFFKLGLLIHELTLVKERNGLFAVLVTNWDYYEVRDILTNLWKQSPATVIDLVEAHMEGNSEGHLAVPIGASLTLTPKYHYYLDIISADIRPYITIKNCREFYIMSRFSRFPSDKIREACLKERPEYSIYEEENAQKMEGSVSAKTGGIGLHIVPREIWLKILLQLDSLSQIYVIPKVCSLWKSLHHDVLDESPMVQREFANDLSDPDKLTRILNLGRYPWNYFLSSRVATFRYLLRRDLHIQTDQRTCEMIRLAWTHVGRELDQGISSTSSGSYFSLYLRCCKAAGSPLTFYQLPGMPDVEYAALIRSLVGQHHVIPILPMGLLKGDCGRFMQMMEGDSRLVALLFENCPHNYDKLVACLYLGKCPIPPEIALLLGEKSALYRLLFGGSTNVDEYFDAVSQSYAETRNQYMLARSVINSCLLLGPRSSPETLILLSLGIDKCYRRVNSSDRIAGMTAEQGAEVLEFLCENREDYHEELHSIERIIDCCGTWDASIKRKVFNACFARFASDPQFTIKWAG